jgi:hypothetical protein
MKKYNTDYEKLSAFLDGELPLPEKNELEEKLSLSSELRQKLEELKKIKEAASAAYKPLPESPYLETRIMANLKHENPPFIRRRWIPITGMAVITLALMLILKFNPGIINRIVDEQTTNLASFYQANLKPLLYASNLSNEDIFNFAFYKELPLDNKKEQFLQIGQDEKGTEFFEIKTSSYNTEENNYEKFVTALNLTEFQKKRVDSILQHYAAELQGQVLVNDRNTVAINPNLWNYNTAIAAELINFASVANEPELRRMMPEASSYLRAADMEKMIVQVKANNDNNFIFLTPDTIFTSWVDVNSDELRGELQKARKEIERASREIHREVNRDLAEDRKLAKRVSIAVRLDSLKQSKDRHKNSRFQVYVGNNNYRVEMPDFHIPEVSIPDMDSITANVDKLLKSVHVYTAASPKNPSKLSKRYNFQYGHKDSLQQLYMPDIPDIDSLIKRNYNFYYDNNRQVDSLLTRFLPEFKFRQDSLTNYFKLYKDSTQYYYDTELQNQLKEIEVEMRRFREEMQNLRKELNKDSGNGEKTRVMVKPIEI